MRTISMIGLLFVIAGAVSFVPVNKIPLGTAGEAGVVSFFDSDHDSFIDLHFTGARHPDSKIFFFNYRPFNRLVQRDSLCWPSTSGWWDVWAAGNLDGDGLADMVVSAHCTLVVFESQSANQFPKSPAWKLPYVIGAGNAARHSVDDFDQDGRKDIIYQDFIPPQQIRILRVLENSGDNMYGLVFERVQDSECRAFGDFDLDDRRDMATACGGTAVTVFECTGDNQYEHKWVDTTLYPYCGNVFSADDADADGKPEFMVGWMRFDGSWTFGFLVYETTGNDQYDVIFQDSVCGIRFRRSSAMSCCGDVDGDGVPEIIWAVGDDWYVYEATGNDQFQRIFEAYPRPNGNGHSSTQVYVCDMNGNGYPEIVESGRIDSAYTRTETTVWEIEGVRLHRPNGGEILQPGSQFPITWEKFSPPGADSFTLFVSFDNGAHYSNIALLQNPNDTLFLWSVPDTLADSVKLMIWAYGPPRAGQQVPRGTAWGFSDSCFSIRQTRVREAMSNAQRAMSLRILQNPTTKAKGIRLLATVHSPQAKLQIYDVAGKMVRSFALGPLLSAPCPIAFSMSPGVYFITLQCEGKTATRKLVVIE